MAKLLVESNFRALGINHLQDYEDFLDIDKLDVTIPATKIQEKFSSSACYKDIVSYLLTLQCPSDMAPSKSKTLKLHIVKYGIMDSQIYWKDHLGFLLSCLVEYEMERES